MFRGLTFWDTVYTSGTVDDAILPLVAHAKATQIGRLLKNDSPGAELDRGAESDVSDVSVHMQTHATDLLLYLGH